MTEAQPPPPGGGPENPQAPQAPPPQAPPPQAGPPQYAQQTYQLQPSKPDAPSAMAALILGITSLSCGGITGPFAIIWGRKTIREVDESGGAYGARGMGTAGIVLGIIGCVLLLFAIGGFILWIVAIVLSASSA